MKQPRPGIVDTDEDNDVATRGQVMAVIEAYPPAAEQQTNPIPYHIYAPQPTVAPPKRGWAQSLASGLGGILAGMLLIALIVAVAGSPRAVPGAAGDPNAAWDLSVVATNAYLTRQAQASENSLVQEPTMSVGADGKVILDARVSIIGPSLPLRATLQPTIVDGKLRLVVTGTQLGGLPLPGLVSRQVESMVATAAQMPATTVPVTLVRVEAKEGQLILYEKAC